MPRHFPTLRRHSRRLFWDRISALVSISIILVVLGKFIEGNLLSIFRVAQREAKLAFFIQVSSTSILQLPRLLKAIWHEKNLYVIHFDAKIGHQTITQVVNLLNQEEVERNKNKNVVVMESEAVSYGGITMLLNTINGISRLLQMSPDWDFFINLSGSDYPLVCSKTLRELLGTTSVINSQLNFLQTQTADKDMDWFFERRMRRLHIDTALWTGKKSSSFVEETKNKILDDGELIDINASHPVSREGASFVKTEGWVILHRSFCQYVVDSAPARRLLLSFATARAPDELFFGTLLKHSEQFRRTMTWDGLRYIMWGRHGKNWGRPAYLDQIPEQREIRMLMSRSGALFARKFAMPESALLDYIDANLNGMAEREWEVNATSVHNHAQKTRKRLLCIAEGRILGVPCQVASESSR